MKLLSGRARRVAGAIAVPVPIALNPATYRGWEVQGTDGERYWSDGQSWRSTRDAIRFVPTNFNLTVGAGGNFPSINAALNEMLRYFNNTRAFAPSSRLTILSGHVITEQIITYGLDLSWIILESQDNWVLCDRSAMVADTLGLNGIDGSDRPFLAARGGATMTMNCAIEFVGAKPAGARDIIGLALDQASHFTATQGIRASQLGFKNADIGISVGQGSQCTAYHFDILDYTKRAVVAVAGGHVTIGRGLHRTVHAATATGIEAFDNGTIDIASLGGVTDLRMIEGVDSPRDALVGRAGSITMNPDTLGGTSSSGGLAAPVNSLLPNGGIIVRGPSPPILDGIVRPRSYTVATLPNPAAYPDHIVMVTDGNAGQPCLAQSNGVNAWLRIVPGAAVSAT